MKIRPVGVLIALLISTNVALGYVALKRDRQINADHLQQIRLNTDGIGTILVTLGTSDTPGGPVAIDPHHAATLALTPRAAIQIHLEIGRVIRDVQAAAAAQRRREDRYGETPGAPRPL
jgi:hypothetical protein